MSIKEERENLTSTVREMVGIRTLEKENDPVSRQRGQNDPST